MDRPGGRLADYLLDRSLLAADQIEAALKTQRAQPKRRFADILVDLGYLSAAQIEALFPKVALLERMVDPELHHFTDSFVHERHDQGSVIFRAGEIGHKAYVLLDGEVRIVHPGPPPFALATVKAGEFFGEMALLDGGHRSASAEATVASEVMVLGRTEFMDQVKAKPEIALDIFRILARRLREADQMLAEARQYQPASAH